jgi:methanol--5-hydroxybenzimidazolylcobamide Co-methyltransferase
VQNVKLLGGMAPTVSLEQLAYATRLMNVATARGQALILRDWFVESDSGYDPQAYVLRPDVVLRLSAEIIAESTAYKRVRRAALATLQALRQAHEAGVFELSRAERTWLKRLSTAADELPEDEDAFIAQQVAGIEPGKVRLDQYDVASA